MNYYDLIGLCPDKELDNLSHLIIEGFISDLKDLKISDDNLKMLIEHLEDTVKALKGSNALYQGEQRIQYVPTTPEILQVN